jgi:hypothetical protein
VAHLVRSHRKTVSHSQGGYEGGTDLSLTRGGLKSMKAVIFFETSEVSSCTTQETAYCM